MNIRYKENILDQRKIRQDELMPKSCSSLNITGDKDECNLLFIDHSVYRTYYIEPIAI